MEGAAHKRLGLTAKQFKVYSLRFAGYTQAQVADQLSITQPTVAEHELQAKARNPALPPLPDHRRIRVQPISDYSNEHGTGLADVLGLA